MTDDRFAILDYLTTEQLGRIDPATALRFWDRDRDEFSRCPLGQALAGKSRYPYSTSVGIELVGSVNDRRARLKMTIIANDFMRAWDRRNGGMTPTDLTAELQARADRRALTDWIAQPAKVEVVAQ